MHPVHSALQMHELRATEPAIQRRIDAAICNYHRKHQSYTRPRTSSRHRNRTAYHQPRKQFIGIVRDGKWRITKMSVSRAWHMQSQLNTGQPSFLLCGT